MDVSQPSERRRLVLATGVVLLLALFAFTALRLAAARRPAHVEALGERLRSVVTLGEQGPYLLESSERGDLERVLQSAEALHVLGAEPVDGQQSIVAELAAGQWDADSGLWDAAREDDDPLVTTSLVLEVAVANDGVRDGRVLGHADVATLIDDIGRAVGERQDQDGSTVARVLAQRSFALLRDAGADTSAATAGGDHAADCRAANQQVTAGEMVEGAYLLELVQATGGTCTMDAAAQEAALDRLRTLTGQLDPAIPPPLGVAVELAGLARLVPPSDTLTRAQQSVASSLQQAFGQPTTLIPVVPAATLSVAVESLPPELRGELELPAAVAALRRTVAWRGTLPDLVTGDAITQVLGAQSLRRADPELFDSLGDSYDAALGARDDALSRAVLRLGTDVGGDVTTQDVAGLLAAGTRADTGVGAAAVVAQGSCERQEASALAAAVTASPELRDGPGESPAGQVITALTLEAAELCDVRDDALGAVEESLMASTARELTALSEQGGRTVDPARLPFLWSALEVQCLRADGPALAPGEQRAVQDALRETIEGLVRPSAPHTTASVYAGLRAEQILVDGCGGGWWEG